MPQINIVDGIQGMDGDGPAAGRQRQLGMLLAGRDAVAVDAVAGLLVGIDPAEISTCRLAAGQGLGVAAPEEIEMVGDDLRESVTEKFVRPRSQLTNLMPTPLVHLLKRFIYTRPQVLPEICTNCNTCVKSCPTEALVPGPEHPEFRPRKCIGCLCCHELCPESAIKLRWSLMARLVP
ncbi:4Fe-4S binding protein [Candidatus Zixiibacteriota bacterium]